MKVTESLTVDKLVKLSTEELLKVFRILEPPDLDELKGEYLSRLPLEREEEVQSYFETTRFGRWLGKAYTVEKVDTYPGQGYNLWLTKSGVLRCSRFAWKIGKSTLDGKSALIMHYDAFLNSSGDDGLHDEIRRIKPGLYMGIYHSNIVRKPFTRGWDEAKNHTLEEVFFLVGPVYDWKGVDDETTEPIRNSIIKGE